MAFSRSHQVMIIIINTCWGLFCIMAIGTLTYMVTLSIQGLQSSQLLCWFSGWTTHIYDTPLPHKVVPPPFFQALFAKATPYHPRYLPVFHSETCAWDVWRMMRINQENLLLKNGSENHEKAGHNNEIKIPLQCHDCIYYDIYAYAQ